MFMPAWGDVLLASFVFLISFGNVGQGRASKTQAVININVVRHRRYVFRRAGQWRVNRADIPAALKLRMKVSG